MDKHGKIPQGPPERKVAVSGQLIKRMTLAAIEAIPAELTPSRISQLENVMRLNHVITEAIRDVIYHPPTLGNSLTMWRRFYAVMFDCELPNIDTNTLGAWFRDLATGYVIVGRHVVTPEALLRLQDKFPMIFHDVGLLPKRTLKWRSVWNCHDFPWCLKQIEPREEEATDFERSSDRDGVLFEDILIWQLFEYWSGRPLSEKPLYANGSRTNTEKVPGIQWVDGKMVVYHYPRESFKYNLRNTQFVTLQC